MSINMLLQKVEFFANSSRNDGVFVSKVLTKPNSSDSPYTYYCYEPKKIKYFIIEEGNEKIVSETEFFEQYRLDHYIQKCLIA
ncbi:MAG: hypothetical protein GX434_00800 [Peptococcaceae bacterium]|nr:hypothetical protein [Peptococcaceae bacterium]